MRGRVFKYIQRPWLANHTPSCRGNPLGRGDSCPRRAAPFCSSERGKVLCRNLEKTHTVRVEPAARPAEDTNNSTAKTLPTRGPAGERAAYLCAPAAPKRCRSGPGKQPSALRGSTREHRLDPTAESGEQSRGAGRAGGTGTGTWAPPFVSFMS